MAFGFRRCVAFAGGFAAIVWAGGAQAALVDLSQYNAFVLGSFNAYNSQTQGRIAAGGSVNLANYNVASGLGAAGQGTATLIAGGSLSASNGRLSTGNAVAAGSSALNGFTLANGSLVAGSPIDFAAQGVLLNALSDSLGALAANGATVKQWGGITLTGTQSGLNIFTLQASDLTGANNFVIDAPTGSQVLVNVVGGAASLQNMGFSVRGAAASDVLLNFYEAGAINLGGIGLEGSILAPGAAVNFNNGHLDGLLVAASYNGGGALRDGGYTGELLKAPLNPVPEPASWAMMIAGFGLVGIMLRRTRAIRLTAIV